MPDSVFIDTWGWVALGHRKDARHQEVKALFTDLSSMAVMEELGIERVLTDDEHFEHVGMGFRKCP